MVFQWASPDKEFYVHVNDDVIPVTVNAYNVLRDRSSYLFPRLLWIDSICINQENPSEKTDQIRLMGEIYSNALLVTIWLSTSPPVLSKLDDFVDNLIAASVFFYIKMLEAKDYNYVSVSSVFSVVQEHIFPWQATCELLDHAYFVRSWIIQEILLASCVRVIYRRVKIDWETFVGGL